MRFLLDQGLPRSTVQFLERLGIASEHVGDLGMASASDAEILETACKRQAVVVSLDSDFHAILAASGATEPSVIRIRIEGLKAGPLANILCQVYEIAANELELGAVVSVTTARIRVRALPIGGSSS